MRCWPLRAGTTGNSVAKRRSRRAGQTRHRPASESLHARPPSSQPTRRRRPCRVQRAHRPPHRRRSPPAVPAPARARAHRSRSARRGVGDGAAADPRARPRRAGGDAAAPSADDRPRRLPRRPCPPDAGAAGARLARAARRRPRRDLPPDVRAGAHGALGLHRRGRARRHHRRCAVPAPALPLRAGLQRLGARRRRPRRRELHRTGREPPERALDPRRRPGRASHRQPVGGLSQPRRRRGEGRDPPLRRVLRPLRHGSRAAAIPARRTRTVRWSPTTATSRPRSTRR